MMRFLFMIPHFINKEMSLSKAKKESLEQDLEKIERCCQQNLSGSNFVGLAIFSGSECNLWKVFNLFTNESECPSYRVKTKPLIDVIDEAVEAALNSRSEVKHINPPSSLDKYGGIGAFLRYKI